MLLLGLVILAYLVGSIPFGLIIGKRWMGIDIRTVGSGNIGATNALRALGPVPGAIVMILDILKGFLPVILAKHLFPGAPSVVVFVALTAIMGHTLSVFLNFKGGKGVATSLGAFIGLHPVIGLISFCVWVSTIYLTRYVSLASMAGAIVMPVMMFILNDPLPYKVFALIAALYVIMKHRPNIVRLLNGTEARWGQKVKVDKENSDDGKGNPQ